MPLRKSPVRTPALLAANRANAKKSAGPKTPQGKARVALNALKHGLYAKRVRQNVIKAGMKEGERLYSWLLSEVARTFEPRNPEEWQQADYFARGAWSQFWRQRRLFQTKPECRLESVRNNFLHLSLLRFRIDDHRRRRGLVFWVQRHRYRTFERWIDWMADVLEGKGLPGRPLYGRPEHRLHVRRFCPGRRISRRLAVAEELTKVRVRSARGLRILIPVRSSALKSLL